MSQLDAALDLLRTPHEEIPTALSLVCETLRGLSSDEPALHPSWRRMRFWSLPRSEGRLAAELPEAPLCCRPRAERHRLLLDVPQGMAIALPTECLEDLWLEAGLSECALLILRGSAWSLVAHVSFCCAAQTREALALAVSMGCGPGSARMRAVCPSDATQAATPYPGLVARRLSPDDWRRAGFETHVYDARPGPTGWIGLARPVLADGDLFVLRGDQDGFDWTPNALEV